jgi:hypothetical protein
MILVLVFSLIYSTTAKKYKYGIHNGELGSSVRIVCGYGLHDSAIEVRFPTETRGFFL